MGLSKQNRLQVEEILQTIIDRQDADMVVVRAADCQILFMGASARARLDPVFQDEEDCKTGYSRLFPGLCGKCPGLDEPQCIGQTNECDLQDQSGRVFSASSVTMNWLDNKPATVWFLRDVNEAREVEQKFYSLAYIDQLTMAPNRQRFKEDFEKVHEQITKNEQCGIVAIFDLDNFKGINDMYGHNTGDIMLRRLSEHISGDALYKGHLYRLGGDEFVLFYADPISKYRNEGAFYQYFQDLLQGTLLSYTLPNIELACTISMGVSFFPKHGTSSSELLRKADIALYKAKEAGGNQIALFEDQYDTAKKLKDLYVNIQPILKSLGRTFGYELIDRGNEQEEDDSSINLQELNRSLDTLELDDIDNATRYFITYSNQLHSASVRNNLPKDKFIVQVRVPDVCRDKHLQLYKELRRYGYSLAMLNLYRSNISPTLLALADYAKFKPGSVIESMQKRTIEQYPNTQFIATNVDTPETFESAKALGYRLFQGFYFNQPTMIRKIKDIDPLKANYFRLLRLSSTEDYVDFQEISAIIASDVALSYKLLKLLNSAAVGLRYRVSSISMAVTYLGEEKLKKWIALLALRGVAADKPLELMRTSLVRAQFGELLAPHFRPRRHEKHVFMVGLFSLLHIALDKPKEELLNEIPLAEEIRDSLLYKNGPYADLLQFYSNYEYSNWDEVSRFADDNGLESQLISDCYIDAVKWYNTLVSI